MWKPPFRLSARDSIFYDQLENVTKDLQRVLTAIKEKLKSKHKIPLRTRSKHFNRWWYSH